MVTPSAQLPPFVPPPPVHAPLPSPRGRRVPLLLALALVCGLCVTCAGCGVGAVALTAAGGSWASGLPAAGGGDRATPAEAGIALGQPVVFTDSAGAFIVARNTTAEMKSFYLLAIRTDGGQRERLGLGWVPHLLPGHERVVWLSLSAPLPAGFAPTFEINHEPNTVDAAAVSRATAQIALTRLTPSYSDGVVDGLAVEVTNRGTVAHRVHLHIAYFRGTELIGVATRWGGFTSQPGLPASMWLDGAGRFLEGEQRIEIIVVRE